MPALPPAPQVLRYDLAHSWAGDPHLTNRFFMRYTGGAPAVADLNSAASGVSLEWGVYIAPLAPADVFLESVTITDLTSETSAQGEYVASVAGTRAGQPLTANDCALLNFQIARRYRGGKPRLYGPWGVTADLATPQQFNTPFQSAVNTAWTNFISHIQATYGAMTVGAQCNVSYYHGFASTQNPVTLRWRNIPTPRPGAAVVDTLTGHEMSLFMGSQRRRVRA